MAYFLCLGRKKASPFCGPFATLTAMFSELFSSKKPAAPAVPVRLFNTLSGEKDTFTPLSKKEVKIYTCGPTVYDNVHIGNLRSYVFSDILRRPCCLTTTALITRLTSLTFGHLTSDADTGEDKMMIAIKRSGKPVTLSAMREVAETVYRSVHGRP